jgi:hypothetical protein
MKGSFEEEIRSIINLDCAKDVAYDLKHIPNKIEKIRYVNTLKEHVYHKMHLSTGVADNWWKEIAKCLL